MTGYSQALNTDQWVSAQIHFSASGLWVVTQMAKSCLAQCGETEPVTRRCWRWGTERLPTLKMWWQIKREKEKSPTTRGSHYLHLTFRWIKRQNKELFRIIWAPAGPRVLICRLRVFWADRSMADRSVKLWLYVQDRKGGGGLNHLCLGTVWIFKSHFLFTGWWFPRGFFSTVIVFKNV